MGTVKRIAKNTGFLLAGRLITKIISLFTVIYIVRYLGDAEYGKYAFSFAFVSFFTIISDLGTHNIIVREISKSPEIGGKLIGNAVLVSTFLSLIAIILSISTIHFMDYPTETEKIVQIASIGLLLGGIGPFGTIYEVNLEMRYLVFFGLASRLFLFAAVFTIILYDFGLTWLVIATVASDAISSILMMLYSKKLVRTDFCLNVGLCKFLLKESLPLALASIFLIIYYRIDVVMLSMMKSDSDVGIYSAAYRLTEALIFIPSTYMVSVFPLMSKYFEKSKENLTFIYIKSLKYLIIIAFPLATGVTFFADEIIMALYGNKFQEAITVLQTLIWATAIMFINYSLGQFLVSINKQKITTISTAICAFINVILNLALIPDLSYQGAAIATVATEFINTLIMVYYLPKFIDLSKLVYDIRAPIIATFVVFILMFMVSDLIDINKLFTTIPLLSYPALIYLLRGIDKDDKNIFNKLIERK